MPGKGALELVENPGSSYYSQLFLVQKVSGLWWLVIYLSSLNGCVILTTFKMNTVSLVSH